jgi:predicted nucleic acid-binding protein
VIFVDTNVFLYAVGRDHALKPEARAFFHDAVQTRGVLATSAEVLQEMMHAYLPVGRTATLDAALALVERSVAKVWSVEPDDVRLSRLLVDRHPGLGARDLLHLACCLRRDVDGLRTFDRALDAAFQLSAQ